MKKAHTFRLDTELVRAIKVISAYEGKSISEIVEEALREYIKRHYQNQITLERLNTESGHRHRDEEER